MIYRGADARRVMAGDCFLHIIRFLHVEYDDEPETCDDPRCFKCSKIRNIFDILEGNSVGKAPLERPRCRRQESIRI